MTLFRQKNIKFHQMTNFHFLPWAISSHQTSKFANEPIFLHQPTSYSINGGGSQTRDPRGAPQNPKIAKMPPKMNIFLSLLFTRLTFRCRMKKYGYNAFSLHQLTSSSTTEVCHTLVTLGAFAHKKNRQKCRPK